MSWKVKYYENGNDIYCEVDHHPVNNVVAGLAMKVELGDILLNGWTPPRDFEPENDEIVLLYLISGQNSTTKSVLDSKRNITPQKQHVVAIPIQQTPAGAIIRGNGKRSKNRVSDEMGGGGYTQNN
ncbi:MAG: hypothetical protein ACI8ZM_000251 [Crocinitomix sp.]|jgi:hypothetical protein